MDYETKILPHAGGYGRYNRLAVVFSWFPSFAVTLNLFSDVFYTLIPDTYHCKPDPSLLPSAFLPSNLTKQDYLDLTIPWVNGSALPSGLFYRICFTLGGCKLTCSLPLQWNLVCSDYWKIPLQHVCFMTGWIVGYIFLGTLCDWLGRRRGFLLSVSLSSLFGVAVCLSSSAVMFLLLRLCQGAMLAGVFVSSYIISECSVVNPLDQSALYCPRALRFDHLLDRFVKWRGAPAEVLLCPGAAADSCHLEKLSHSYFIGTGIQYCFTRNLHIHSSNFYFTYFLRVITGALACIFICLSVNHFGRRGMLLLSAIITGLSSLLLLALTQYLQGGLVLVLSVVGLLFSQALAMLSAFFSCEVMPTVVRGGCFGLVMAAGCVGMAASSLMELQNNGGYFLHHVIFASFAVLSVLCIMLLPESKHKSLPDSLKEGESQRRPPLFLSRPNRDHLPLLPAKPDVFIPVRQEGQTTETLKQAGLSESTAQMYLLLTK
uniref:Solute carrier family 22 member 31 n=1 Tax=Nothobranchius furzeri TaxID=105023 RepID=A0A8C6MIU9_NOTFU